MIARHDNILIYTLHILLLTSGKIYDCNICYNVYILWQYFNIDNMIIDNRLTIVIDKVIIVNVLTI